jgi:hypothetical protein
MLPKNLVFISSEQATQNHTMPTGPATPASGGHSPDVSNSQHEQYHQYLFHFPPNPKKPYNYRIPQKNRNASISFHKTIKEQSSVALPLTVTDT